MHSRIEFYMHWVACNALFLRCFNQCVQQTEAINLRLEVVIEQRFERTHFRIHYHYVARNAVSAQRSTFVSHCNRKIIYTMLLQSLCYLYGSGSIGIGFYHANQLCLGL